MKYLIKLWNWIKSLFATKQIDPQPEVVNCFNSQKPYKHWKKKYSGVKAYTKAPVIQ